MYTIERPLARLFSGLPEDKADLLDLGYFMTFDGKKGYTEHTYGDELMNAAKFTYIGGLLGVAALSIIAGSEFDSLADKIFAYSLALGTTLAISVGPLFEIKHIRNQLKDKSE